MIDAAITAALAFLKGIPWKAWVALIAFVLIVLAFKLYGDRQYEAGQAERQGLWDKATAEANRIARATEEGWRKGVTEYTTNATRARLAREADQNRVIDGLRTGAVRVRPRLGCSVPKPAGAAGRNDDPTPGPDEPRGFQESDAAVVLRIGYDADEVSARLAECQNYVRTVRGG